MSLLLAVSTPPVVVATVTFVQAAPPPQLEPGRSFITLGATILGAGLLLAPHSSIAQPAMAQGSTTLLRGAVLPAAGRALAPDSSFSQPALPTGSPAVLRGAAPPAAGQPLTSAPSTVPLSAPTSDLLRGAILPAAGRVLAPDPSFGQPSLPTGQPTLLRGSAPLSAGRPLAAAPSADPPPTPSSTILRGATLPAAGRPLAPDPSFGQPSLPTGQPTVLRGASIAAAGSALTAPLLTTAPSAPSSAMLRGAALASAGSALSAHPSFGQPSLPTGSLTTLPGARLSAAGAVLAAAPRAADMPTVAPRISVVAIPSRVPFILEPHPSTRQTVLPAGHIEILPDPLLPDAGNILEQPLHAETPAAPRSSLIEGAYGVEPPPDPPAPIPRIGRFSNPGSSNASAGGSGGVSWISLPGQPPSLVQGNWTRDPIVVEPDGAKGFDGTWLNDLLGRSGFAALAPVRPAAIAPPRAMLDAFYLSVAQGVAARARTEQAQRIAAEHALQQERSTRAALEQTVQMLTARLQIAEVERAAPTMVHIELEEAPPFYPHYEALEAFEPEPEPAAPMQRPARKLWPIAIVGAAMLTATLLFANAISSHQAPPRCRKRARRSR